MGAVPFAELFKLVLGLPPTCEVFGTPGFGKWLDEQRPEQDLSAAEASGLWLVDSLDPLGRRLLSRWGAGSSRANFQAALVLSSNQSAIDLGRMFQRVFRGHPQRMRASVTRRLLRGLRPRYSLSGLAYLGKGSLPSGFWLQPSDHRDGAAFLLTPGRPFGTPLWSRVAALLGAEAVQVVEIQLRRRGAVVAMIRSGADRYVLRLVVDRDLQQVVRRNHTYLEQLRALVTREPSLLRTVPEPVFLAVEDPALILCETHLTGTLAWRLEEGPLAGVVYANTLGYLDALRRTTQTQQGAYASELLRRDLQRLEAAEFVDWDVHGMIRQELLEAEVALRSVDALPLHASHGDFGYGNILVEPDTGEVTGVIDWDGGQLLDLPGIDRVNFEIQRRRSMGEAFEQAVRLVWQLGLARDVFKALESPAVRALYGVAVCRYVLRTLDYPSEYGEESRGFREALQWLRTSLQLEGVQAETSVHS